jgi:hypothetical protein
MGLKEKRFNYLGSIKFTVVVCSIVKASLATYAASFKIVKILPEQSGANHSQFHNQLY